MSISKIPGKLYRRPIGRWVIKQYLFYVEVFQLPSKFISVKLEKFSIFPRKVDFFFLKNTECYHFDVNNNAMMDTVFVVKCQIGRVIKIWIEFFFYINFERNSIKLGQCLCKSVIHSGIEAILTVVWDKWLCYHELISMLNC